MQTPSVPLLAFFLVLQGLATAHAADWPQYGGPARDGTSAEKGLLKEWPGGGPPLLWKRTDLGTGYSPVSVAGSRLYTLAFRGDDEFVVALDRGTGKELWATSLGAARESHAMAFLRQRQPLVDDDRLYAFSTAGHLVCLDTDGGKELWRKKYAEHFRGRSSPFGWTDYPLLDGDRLICTPGGKDAFHVALDAATGKVRWKSAAAEGLSPSHSPLVVAEVGGVRQYVQNLGGGLAGFSAKDGKLLWRYDNKVSSGTANMATAAVIGDRVFAVSGVNTGCALLRLGSRKRGAIEVEELYHDRKFRNFHGGIVRLGDHVYSGNGGGFGTAMPACYDWKKGKLLWQHKGPGKGAVATITADGRLYLRFADGLMVLAEATPDGFKEKGRFAQPNRSKVPAWSVPVIAHRRLFLRDQQVLLCYDLRQKATAQPQTKPAEEKRGPRQPDAVFIPSPPEVVAKMLEMAGVGKADVVYDLGCGDGRVVVAAAKKYGARGVGIELDATLVRQARKEAHKQGVQGLVTIKEGDLFEADLGGATVIALYLLPRLNAKLLPKLKGLKRGTRVVSHAFPLPGIRPDKVVRFPSADHLTEHTVYLYAAPLRPQRGMD